MYTSSVTEYNQLTHEVSHCNFIQGNGYLCLKICPNGHPAIEMSSSE